MVVCLERGADLHMALLMPQPLTVSCFSKIQIGFTFLVPTHPGSPGQTAFSLPRSAASFTAFTLLTVDDVVNAVRQRPDKFSATDPLPTSTLKTSCRSSCAVHRRRVQPFAGSRSLPRGFQEGVRHSDGEEAWHGHDQCHIIPADLELASAVETPGAPRRPPAHGLVAVHRPAASQPELI